MLALPAECKAKAMGLVKVHDRYGTDAADTSRKTVSCRCCSGTELRQPPPRLPAALRRTTPTDADIFSAVDPPGPDI